MSVSCGTGCPSFAAIRLAACSTGSFTLQCSRMHVCSSNVPRLRIPGSCSCLRLPQLDCSYARLLCCVMFCVSSQPWRAAQPAFSVRPSGCMCLIKDWQSASVSRKLDVGCLLLMTCALDSLCCAHREHQQAPGFEQHHDGLSPGRETLSLPVD